MRNFSLMFSGISLLGILLFLSACDYKKNNSGSAPAANASGLVSGVRIAYVNIDSLESHYELLKKRNEEFKGRQAQMEAELEQSYQQMQSKGEAMQKRAQSQSMSQSEIESAQKQLLLMQQSLEGRKQSLTDQLLKEREDFQKEIKKKLDSFLETYNKDKKYDYILSYSSAGGSTIMFANKQLEITKDVIDGMNALAKSETDGKKK